MKIWTEEETKPFLTGWRPAEILYWYDADTPKIRIDLGFGVDGYKGYVRLISENALITPDDKSDDIVDAWELRGVERPWGQEAKARVLELIPQYSTVRVWSYKGDGKRGKYGRYLTILLYEKSKDEWISIGDQLIVEGHATDNL